MADPVGEYEGFGRPAGIEHPYEIRLDLEVYVVCMGIVFPESRCGRINAVEYVVTCHLVGVPQHESGIREGIGIGLCRAVKAVFHHGLQEGDVHVNVIIQAGNAGECLKDIVLVPGNSLVVGDGFSKIVEFRRTSICAANGLPVPAAADLVAEDIVGNRDLFPVWHSPGTGAGGKDKEAKNEE